MYTTTLQFTRFQNILKGGKVDKENATYGYRLYSVDGSSVYCNTYDSYEDLVQDINSDTVVDHIREEHEDFYDIILEEGGLEFNGKMLNIRGEFEDDDDDTSDTLLPDHSELPNGEPKYVINMDSEDKKEVDQIIKDASKDLIK